MELKFFKPRGTHDIYPPQINLWQKIVQTSQNIFNRYNYKEIKTPIFEHTELFLKAIGEGTDIVNKEMYTFFDKKNRSLTLRPEGTAGVVRAYIENKLYLEPVTKLYYIGPMFRYERSQTGRQRQFEQVGIEVFGVQDPIIDAEGINLILSIYNELNVPNLSLKINSIGCEKCRESYKLKLKEYFFNLKDKLCSDCQIRLEKNPLRILDCKVKNCKDTHSNAPYILDFLCSICEEHFDKLKMYLNSLNINYEIEPKLVRGLDYYTKTVFEIISNSSLLGAQNTLCGGGRYDNLVYMYGGEYIPAFGWAYGLERVILALDNKVLNNKLDYLIIPLCEQGKIEALKIASLLRSKKDITVDISYLPNNSLKKHLKYANKLEAKNVILLGEDEINNRQITIKNMDTGEQRYIPLNKFEPSV